MAPRPRDLFFWWSAGSSLPDRARLLAYWLSPRLLRSESPVPRPVRTRFLGGRPIHVRRGSPDVRVLRNIFVRGDYWLDPSLTGPVRSIVDLGAYTGLSALYFAERYPEARILAVEPDPSNCECLLRNLESFVHRERIRVCKACLSDRDGVVGFDGRGPSWARRIGTAGDLQVEAVTLPRLLREEGFDRVDLLKMDVEGAESLAFASPDAWLGRVGWILLELHLDLMEPAALLEALRPWGRRVFLREPSARGGWRELDPDLAGRIGERTRYLDVVVPPADRSDALRASPSVPV